MFFGEIKKLLQVDLVKGIDGELEDASDLTYVSPKAIDLQNDKILMKFKGTNKFIKAESNSDDTFVIKVIKEKLPLKSESYIVRVRLEDDRGKKQLKDTLVEIKVEFTDKMKEHEEAAKDEEDKKD